MPIPEIHLRRVGDHEAASARRAAELGDGTPECRTVSEVVHYLSLLMDGPDLCEPMNERILSNYEAGIYDGAKNSIDCAMTRS